MKDRERKRKGGRRKKNMGQIVKEKVGRRKEGREGYTGMEKARKRGEREIEGRREGNGERERKMRWNEEETRF